MYHLHFCLIKIARMLPLIVELAQFVDRINVVFLNGVRQFSSLYHERQALYHVGFVYSLLFLLLFLLLCFVVVFCCCFFFGIISS